MPEVVASSRVKIGSVRDTKLNTGRAPAEWRFMIYAIQRINIIVRAQTILMVFDRRRKGMGCVEVLGFSVSHDT